MEAEPRRPRSLPVLAAILAVAAALLAALLALGAWQLHRLAWKEALIERVERNLRADPVAAPGPAGWQALAPGDEYRRLHVRGRFLPERQALVRASTVLGGGYWVLAPLRTQDGWWVLVNRGFVPPELRTRVPQAAGEQEIAGLLRPGEPAGSLLQDNDPAAGRWYSRDVAAIAAAMGLTGPVAPYFIDAQGPGAAAGGAWPRAGLTVVQFRNHHLAYALTWFVLAAIMGGAIVLLVVDERRLRRRQPGPSVAHPPS